MVLLYMLTINKTLSSATGGTETLPQHLFNKRFTGFHILFMGNAM
ncbi:hypothetical protein Ahy_Scaffold1g106977 isoform G [Arachis hypogaea]|uniref:Uncharacterized protein n=1 Tax=Arachis hypogaea TaxID=3818 RepID=A0A444WTZ7_ARAHY|nr:hypothetical protein Ahy_Scaffold1g106977 isoform G [Arachis hypogaea]